MELIHRCEGGVDISGRGNIVGLFGVWPNKSTCSKSNLSTFSDSVAAGRIPTAEETH